jgi:hypothetical protein
MAGPVDHLREWECDHVLPGTLGCRASNSCQLFPTSQAPSVGMERQPVFSLISEAYPDPSLYSLASEGPAMGVSTPWRPRIQGRDSNGAMPRLPPPVPHQSIEIVSLRIVCCRLAKYHCPITTLCLHRLPTAPPGASQPGFPNQFSKSREETSPGQH